MFDAIEDEKLSLEDAARILLTIVLLPTLVILTLVYVVWGKFENSRLLRKAGRER